MVSSLIVMGAILMAGCRLGDPSGASFASVKIDGSTPEQIAMATATVFREEGYMVGSMDPSNMVFQKEGSRGQSLAYGGVYDTHYGATTAVRVKASVESLGGGVHRLQCKAYMVRNANDSFFADESPLANIRSHPYQKILDEVAKRLK